MHVIVLGAGVIGVTTAYYLSRSGHRVTLVDRAASIARGASHANGGQLSYSFTDSFAQPSILARLPAIALGADPAVCISRLLDPAFLAWSASFIAQCTRSRATANTLRSLTQALRSRTLLEELRTRLPIEFGHRKAGKLVLLRRPGTLRSAARMMREKRRHGCDVEVLSRSEAIAVEPAIAAMDERFCGAIYGECDEVGDTRVFTERLFEWLVENAGAAARLDTDVLGLDTNGQGFCGVRSTGGAIAGDAVVVCLGAYSNAIARSGGLKLKLFPARGYSLTLPAGPAAPACSITDLENKVLFSPLPSGLRITGFLDFVGLTTHRDPVRIRALKRIAARTAPDAADYGASPDEGWGGFRPMTPNGQAIVGATSVPGVFTNVGHGSLGWTLACGSAFDAAAAVDRWQKTIGN